MKKIYSFAIVLLAALAVSCGGSVGKAMDQVEKALERVEKNKAAMTQADWQALQTELEEPLQTLATALEKDQVGPIKRVELMMLTGRVAALFMEAGMNTVVSEMESAGISPDDLQQAVSALEQAPPSDTVETK